jgi:SAM-dependent methyltransferase
MWGQGGKAYNQVSFAISDALAHAAQRLNPKPGQVVLDVATGTGWSARNVARMGANVTAIDISPELLEAAEELSSHLHPAIVFRLADAERLPFADGSFDGIISTFGVMFAMNHLQAAAELARVCRRGGRLALATWAPGGSVAEFFGVIASYADAPAPAVSPLAWGDPKHVEELLGRHFELGFESGVNHAYHDDVDDIWEWYTRGFGPLRQLVASLDPDRRQSLRKDIDAYHRKYETPLGLHVKREYLVVVGRRR